MRQKNDSVVIKRPYNQYIIWEFIEIFSFMA